MTWFAKIFPTLWVFFLLCLHVCDVHVFVCSHVCCVLMSAYVCTCVFMHVHMYVVCTHVCIYVIYMCWCVHMCIVYPCLHMHVCLCMFTHVCCVYSCLHVCDMHMFVRVHMCMLCVLMCACAHVWGGDKLTSGACFSHAPCHILCGRKDSCRTWSLPVWFLSPVNLPQDSPIAASQPLGWLVATIHTWLSDGFGGTSSLTPVQLVLVSTEPLPTPFYEFSSRSLIHSTAQNLFCHLRFWYP